eukprot:TRINITY_DN22666_c3_g1_i1.p1 TRINITY_DN22666_c3_g1~~TRINITY_DN22666_c3_g1_i1.p1  ORF type:complete len:820 (-),score=174.53 TRINITY_DN22666_c3_g1_i1:93-2552(-)
MGKAKPVTATVDELEAAKTELKNSLGALNKKKADKDATEKATKEVQSNVDDLADTVKKNADTAKKDTDTAETTCKEYTDSAEKRLADKVEKVHNAVNSGQEAEFKSVRARIAELDVEVRTAFANELTSLCSKIDAEFTALREELIDHIETRAREADERTTKERNEVDAIILEKERQSMERDTAAIEKAEKELTKAVEILNQAAAKARDIDLEEKKVIDERIVSTNADIAQLRVDAKRDTEDLRVEASEATRELTEETHATFHTHELRDDRLSLWLSEVAEVSTRRVEWHLQNASTVLQPPSRSLLSPASTSGGSTDKTSSYSSYFSEKFDAAGTRDLQFELRLYPPAASSLGTSSPASPSASWLSSGGQDCECGLFLWSPGGLQMNLRLFAGEKSITVDREKSSSRGPKGVKKMGLLKDHINPDDDTLRVGVEILEAIREMHEKAVDIYDNPDRSPELEAEEECPEEPFQGGKLMCYRNINHRILPQVRREVEKLQAKMIRRVEWLVKEADSLTDVFPHRTPICSPVFSAAGVEGMQLIIYPSGYTDSMEGFLSAFLYCPAGVKLKCHLSAGNQKREISNHFKEAAAYGRTNFCRLDSAVNTDTNTLLIAFEIEDIVQEVTKEMALDPREKYKKQPAPTLETAGPPKISGSAVKLIRFADRGTLTEVNQLPALWTAEALGEMVKIPEKYKQFSDLPEKAQANRRRGGPKPREDGPVAAATTSPPYPQNSMPPPLPKTGVNFSAAYGGVAKSDSMPALRGSLDGEHWANLHAAASAGQDSLPLICGPQNEWGTDQGHGSPLLWAGKSRKARGVGGARQTQ